MNTTLGGSLGGTLGGAQKAPWHLWVVGFLTMLWNAVGCFSYTITRFGLLADFGMSETEIAFFESQPVWANTFWALGVWGAIAGSILILFRSRWALHAIIIAIIGLLGSNVYQYAIADVPETLQSPALTMLIWATTLFMLFYASRMSRSGVLR